LQVELYKENYFTFMYVHNNQCHQATAHLQLNILIVIITIKTRKQVRAYHIPIK